MGGLPLAAQNGILNPASPPGSCGASCGPAEPLQSRHLGGRQGCDAGSEQGPGEDEILLSGKPAPMAGWYV